MRCSNFKFDTTLVGSLLDENRSNGLDIHCKIYAQDLGGYSDVFDKTVDKSRMDKVAPATLLPYAAGDADATLRVSQVEKAELLKDPALTSFYVNIMHPAARAFEIVEQGGVFVDLERYKELRADLNTEILHLTGEARKVIGGRVWAKHYDMTKPGSMNLMKASMLTDFMFSPMGLNLTPKVMTAGGEDGTKEKKPSTALDHLLMFEDVPEAHAFVSLLKDYASATKTLQTYVDGFMKHLRSDGRYHPSYYFFAGNKDEGDGGTNTGRLSCKDPAFQTLPKHTKWAKRLRLCFLAPPGMLVAERDYSQGELKVIACIANEPTMIEAYKKGLDLHVITSGNFAGYSYEQMMVMKKVDKEQFDAIRQLGKAGNFGLIYGMSGDGFFIYAVVNYGVKDLTKEMAYAFRDGFFQTYQQLPVYHQQYKAFAKMHGHVRSPLGRIRHLPLINSSKNEIRSKAERQAINSPVQGCLSDMLLWTVALEEKQGLSAQAPCFGAIHDAAYNYVPEDKAESWGKASIQVMENLPFEIVGWQPQLKFTADLKLGPSMGELKEAHL
jgi:DNA polymerase I-like protein with 3'-5' exonuclease and polymerase domains